MVSDKRWKFVGNSGTSERARVAALFLAYKYWLSGPGKEALELRLAWRLSGPLLSLWTGDIPVQKCQKARIRLRVQPWPTNFEDSPRFSTFESFAEVDAQNQSVWDLLSECILQP